MMVLAMFSLTLEFHFLWWFDFEQFKFYSDAKQFKFHKEMILLLKWD